MTAELRIKKNTENKKNPETTTQNAAFFRSLKSLPN